MNELKEYTEKVFEDIKHIDEFGNEYWLASELQSVFEYTQWRRFENTIIKAKTACNNFNISIEDHFANVGKMINLGKGGTRSVMIINLAVMLVILLHKMAIQEKRLLHLHKPILLFKQENKN